MLKPKQRQIAEIMVLEPDLRNEDYAARVGINPKTLYMWKREEEFNDYLHELCREKFKHMERLALQKLKENVKKGNQKAIEYILDGTGYKAAQELDIKGSETITLKVDIDE